MSYHTWEQRLDNVVSHAWEAWTSNGLHMDEDEREQAVKSCRDAATNTYVEGLNDGDWLAATVRRLNGEG